MKEVYLIRHAEKDSNGILTPGGEDAATALGQIIPIFARVFSSDSLRAQKTAELITGQKPEIDLRAGFYMAPQEKSDEINLIASENDISFLEAVSKYNDPEVIDGVEQKAKELRQLINEVLDSLDEDEKAIIVSHDLSISPEVAIDGIPLSSIDFLQGYIIRPGEIPQPTKF